MGGIFDSLVIATAEVTLGGFEMNRRCARIVINVLLRMVMGLPAALVTRGGA